MSSSRQNYYVVLIKIIIPNLFCCGIVGTKSCWIHLNLLQETFESFKISISHKVEVDGKFQELVKQLSQENSLESCFCPHVVFLQYKTKLPKTILQELEGKGAQVQRKCLGMPTLLGLDDKSKASTAFMDLFGNEDDERGTFLGTVASHI